MSNQIVISSGAKVRNLGGVLTATAGVVSSVGYGTANGVATLDANGKVPLSQLPASVVTYLGTWNASTNTPTLANGTGDIGDLYICNVAGTVNFGAGPITFAVGDWVIYNGSQWQKSAGSSGTVTSVAMTVPTGLSVTGSPITTSGTLALSLASGYTIPTTSFLSGLVPYTGATGNVNLGEYGLSGGYLGLDTTPTGTPTTLGTISWDDTYLTPKVITGTGVTTLQIGQEEVVLIHNNTGSTLTDGQVVYINGSTGNLPTVALADASSETTSAATLGVVTESIANGSNGFITISGNVNGLNTLGYTAGDILWLSETAGQFTNVKPISPAHLVLIGYVVKVSGGNGSILVKIQNTQELEECSDVLFTSLANNDILAYESSTDLWKNKTIANVLGYTPANDSLVVHLAGNETITGSKTFSAATEFTSSQSVAFNYGLGIAKGNTPSIFSSSAVYLYSASGDNNLIIKDNTNTSKLQFQAASSYTYTFPASTGTVALTSDIPSLTGYVPYTGATSSLNLGNYGLTASSVFVSSVGTNAGQVQLKQGSVFTTPNGYGTFGSGGANDFYFYQNTSSVVRGAILSLGSITASATRTYTLPDADGTLALTSNLSGYLPLTGGTLTGGLYINPTNTGVVGLDVASNNTSFRSDNLEGSKRQLLMTMGSGTLISITGKGYEASRATDIAFYTSTSGGINSSPSIYMTGGGNVGIGTGSVGAKLEVSSTGEIVRFRTSGTDNYFTFFNSAGSQAGDIGYDSRDTNGLSIWNNVSNGNLIFGAGASRRMTILGSNGNVGIGTSSPTSIFHVSTSGLLRGRFYSSANASFLDIENASNSFYIGTDDSSGSQFGVGAYSSVIWRAGTYPIVISTNNTERMRITSGGGVMIGTSSDTGRRLYVLGSTSNSSAWNSTFDNSSGGTIIGFRNDGLISTGGTLSYSPYNLSITPGRALYVDSSGTLGYVASIRESKININPIDSAALINELNPVSFNYRKKDENNQYTEEFSEDLFYGLIADEVEKIDKNLVFYNYKEDGTKELKGVYYEKLTAILIKAVQELSAKVSALENKS